MNKDDKYYAYVDIYGKIQRLDFSTFMIDGSACLHIDHQGGFTIFSPNAWKYVHSNPDYVKEEG